MKKLLNIAAFAAVCLTPHQPALSQRVGGNVNVVIQYVGAIDNMDMNLFKADRTDFYARVRIGDGPWQKSETVWGKDAIRPYWRFSQFVPGSVARIHIQLWDDDVGLEGTDDRCDINPLPGARELIMFYNLSNGQISGDISGRRGVPIFAQGYGDPHKAAVRFVVNH